MIRPELHTDQSESSWKTNLLDRWTIWASHRGFAAIAVVLGITLLLGIGFALLRLDMTFFSIMPRSSQQVQDLEHIVNEFPFASNITIAVDARDLPDSASAKAAVIRTIDALAAEFSQDKYAESIAGVTAQLDRRFFERHGLMLMPAEDLRRLSQTFADTRLVPLLGSINDDLEAEYSGNSGNLKDDEALASAQFKAFQQIVDLIAQAAGGVTPSDQQIEQTLDTLLVGETHFLSDDERMGILFLLPTFTMNDISDLKRIETFEERAVAIAEEYGVKAGLTGMIVVAKDEMVTSEQGLGISMTIAFLLVIALMVLAFRMPSVPLIAGIPLILGILWTVGAAGLLIRRLNIMTAMYMVALIGLGIDYAIHLLSAYIQARDDGDEFYEAIRTAMRKSGSGIVTGALTTAAAFLALTISKTDIVKELGVVAGIGILCEMIAMLMMIPALLGVRHRRLKRRGKDDTVHRFKVRIRSSLTGRLGTLLTRRPGTIAVILLASVILLSLSFGAVGIEDNIMNMEAKGLTSIELQDTLVEEFGMAPDGLFLLSTDRDEMTAVTSRLKRLATVKSVDSIAPFFPTDQQTAERTPLIEDLLTTLDDSAAVPAGSRGVDEDALLEEILRLESNMVELGDLAYLSGLSRISRILNQATGIDDDGERVAESAFDRLLAQYDTGFSQEEVSQLQQRFSTLLAARLTGMADTRPITREMLPPMISDAYISRDGGSYLLTINPTANPWEGDFRSAFRAQVATVTDRGTGMILAADELTRMATVDGVRSSILALIAVFIILLADFRNLKLTLLTFIPLLCSIISLFGIMGLTGIKFDFVNIIAIPLLIGIGIDDAVHISHRYRMEGPGSLALTIERTGTAVLLTTITTVIGFASFIPSIMRAMRSTGIVLSVAMTLAFIYSVMLHPALLYLVRERLGARFTAWGMKGGKES